MSENRSLLQKIFGAAPEKGIRLWPALLLLVLFLAGQIWVWMIWSTSSQQNRVMGTMAMVILALAGLGMWFLFLSRLAWKARFKGLAVLALIGVLLGMTIEVREFTGDVVPVLAFRWQPRVDETLGNKAGEGASPAEVTTTAYDFPQFLGPGRNAVLPNVRLARDWTTEAPKELWRKPIGAGWSGFAVVGNLAVTQEQRGPDEMVTCYDLKSGEILWTHGDANRFSNVLSGDGPRATPSIADGFVYTLGAKGILNKLRLATGEKVWSRQVMEENDAPLPEYGFCASPLVLDDRVIVVVGGPENKALIAYDTASGEPVWSAGNAKAAYSSPMVVELAGTRQIAVFYESLLMGHDATDGTVLWQHEWPEGTQCTSQPLPLEGDRIFLSSGYGTGCKLFQIKKEENFSASMVWETNRMKAKFTNVIYKDGYIYGLDDGIMVCLDPADGQRKWKRGRFGHGHVLLAGDLLVVQSEKGEVVLVDPKPDGLVELGRFKAIDGKSWNTPALAGPYLLIRNAREVACFQLPLAGGAQDPGVN